MFSFEVNPGWFDAYWYSNRPQPERKSLAGRWARLKAVVVLVASNAEMQNYFHG